MYRHLRRIEQRGEFREHDPVPVLVDDSAYRFDGEAGLAGAPASGDRDGPMSCEKSS